jgi:hypothetical protein
VHYFDTEARDKSPFEEKRVNSQSNKITTERYLYAITGDDVPTTSRQEYMRSE